MAVLAEWDAEDRVVRYLATLPPNVAVVTAVNAAVQLVEAWEIEKSEMLRHVDGRRVYLSTAGERLWLDLAVRKYRGDPCWQHCPVAEVRDRLDGLPPDAAGYVAYLVARWVCRHERVT